MVNKFEKLETELMQVELPQLDEEDSDLESEVEEIKEFRDQIFAQIETSTEIAKKDLKESLAATQPKPKKVLEFGNTLKSSLIQYLEKENKEASQAAPEETVDIQLASLSSHQK